MDGEREALLRIPSKGERVELRRGGIRKAGTVWYADQLQVLVKWDDGQSSSLRRDSAHLRTLVDEKSSLAAEKRSRTRGG
jgi:hypothetical protein